MTIKQTSHWCKSGMKLKTKAHDAVGKGWITAEEYEVITGEPYEAE